jgi:membrane protein
MEFFGHLIHRYNDDGCRESAAALTYMSLFAVVPLMTLMYSMFSIIPSFQGLGDNIEQLLFEYMIPESGLDVQQYLREFSGQARKLSSVGGIILIATSYLMLTNIEKTFNHIWGTVGGRRGLSGFLLYWGVLSLGPLLVGTGLLMHTYLLSFQIIVDEVDALGVTAMLLEYLPWLMTWAGFTLLYIAMPNCRVVGRYAIIGGLITAISFELAKNLFGLVVTNSSYYTVYGAFAIVPLFLLWVYLCWMIVLGGAELVRSLETFNLSARKLPLPDLIALALICFECLDSQSRGVTTNDRDVISLGIREQQWRKLRTVLLDNKVLVITSQNSYVLARDPSELTLWELIGMLGGRFTDIPDETARHLVATFPWYEKIELIANGAGSQVRSMFGITLQELFHEHSQLESQTNQESRPQANHRFKPQVQKSL